MTSRWNGSISTSQPAFVGCSYRDKTWYKAGYRDAMNSETVQTAFAAIRAALPYAHVNTVRDILLTVLDTYGKDLIPIPEKEAHAKPPS